MRPEPRRRAGLGPSRSSDWPTAVGTPRAPTAIERLMAVLDAPDRPSRHAFLDLAEPDLDAVVGDLAAAGHRRIVVVPLLFTVAFHATIDVPQAVVRAAAEHAGVELEVADILGTGDDVAALLLTALADAGVSSEVSVLLYAVGSSNSAANVAVVELAARLERSRSFSGVPGGRPPAQTTVAVPYAPPSRPAHLVRPRCWTSCPSHWRSFRCSWPTACCSTPHAPWPPATAGPWSSRWGSGPPISCWSATSRAPVGRRANSNRLPLWRFRRRTPGGATRRRPRTRSPRPRSPSSPGRWATTTPRTPGTLRSLHPPSPR